MNGEKLYSISIIVGILALSTILFSCTPGTPTPAYPVGSSGSSMTSGSGEFQEPVPGTTLTDSDGDYVPDDEDKCPTTHGGVYSRDGCPDGDNDGVPDKDDMCVKWGDYIESGEKTPVPGLGCPIKFSLRWMGMKILSERSYPSGWYTFMYHDSGDQFDCQDCSTAGFAGLEPYVYFTYVNGMTDQGSLEHGSARWCCGERVYLDLGGGFEPDQDNSGVEPDQPADQDILDHGLTVFPFVQGEFAEIDRKLDLVLSATLMERDWTTTITPEKQAIKLDAIFKIGGEVFKTGVACNSGEITGCFSDIGTTLKSVIDTILDGSQPETPVQVQDPDDLSGTDTWTISRRHAQNMTSPNGVYAFWFDVPTTYTTSCGNVQPCGPANSYIMTMRANLYFCLVREGVTETEVTELCSPSKAEQVVPWPME